MEKNDTHMNQFEEGKRVLMKGADGDINAVKIAYEIFLKLRKAEPDNALIEAYYGSALALLARDAVQPLEKADKAQEGLDSLNQAISMDPNQKEIRLLRSKVCLRLPESFFHCSQTAIEDFSFLLDRYKEDPSYLTNKQVREIMEDLSATYQNTGKLSEANEVLQRLNQLNRQLENVSEKDIEIFLEQVIPLHKDAVESNEKAVQEKKNDTHMNQFEEGKRVLMKGADGDINAVKIAYEIFLKLRKAEPDNALIEAYYGSALALLARDAVQPLEKADKAQEGLDSLNQAISMDPNQKEIRLLRSKVCLRLPESFFHCSQTAIEDFSFLLDRYKEDPSYLTNMQVRGIMEDLSTAYQNVGKLSEANEVLQRLTQLNSQLENVSEKDIEIFLEQVIPLHKDAVESNEKAVQEKKNDTHMNQFEEGKRVLLKGADGDINAVKIAYEIFLNLRKAEPDNALIEAYYGSALALLARDAVQPLEKADKAQEGLDSLNQAISMDPNQKEIRLLRSKVCLRLPESFFHCSQTAIEDFSFLLDRYKEDPSYLTNMQVRGIMEDLSTAYQNVGKLSEANEVLQRLTQLNSQLENVSEKDIEIFLEQVIPLHKDALEGNKKAVQDMHQLLELARSDYPGHPLVDAYYGITMMLIARDKASPLSRLRGSKAGLKLLDGAVSAAPQDGRIRLLRGRAAYRLPEEYFHRAQTVIEDYTFLIDREMHEEGFLETENYLQLIYELGEAYCRIGRNQAAIMCWKRLKNETQDPDFLHLLKIKLKSLEGKPAVEHIPIAESPTSILIKRAVRAAGSELLNWAEE